ncbi:DNA cytosine methyltransferase [Clostridium frigidicarnis]|uniref:Cytosine-specific methyltransferase n=1 Tax=Clostridium frigidicarnis TaxID=84698 RepID=A0A1I1AKN4_9CLOT|nr:DNA cytosine methyltransferase [Clostridium frigidicarnis]SFB38579.1 DNA (cytosine-5)-methyltransferase 1 [Clostridium frigidicarnis]
MYTYIDLFAGPGGLCTGFKNAGFKPLIAVEMSDNTVKTYARNHDAEIYKLEDLIENKGTLELILNLKNEKTVLIHGDIRLVDNEIILEVLNKKFNVSKVDVVAGGPPCESFSLAGKRLDGDERDNLFENMLRIAHTVESKYVFFENVPGLLTKKSNDINIFNVIIDEFNNHGYKLASTDKNTIKCLAADYGVPQNRERVFLVAINEKYGENKFIYPEKTHGDGRKFPYVTVGEALKYLPKLNKGEGEEFQKIKYSYEEEYKNKEINESFYEYIKFISGKEGYIPEHIKHDGIVKVIENHKAVNHREKMVNRLSYIEQGEGMKKAAERLINDGKQDIVTMYFPKKLYAARNRRLRENEPSFTVTSHCLDEMVHPINDRGLTPRETARLQSFPDWYVFEGEYVKFHSDPLQDKYEQCGDAIPVLLVKSLANKLRIALDNIEKETLNEVAITK